MAEDPNWDENDIEIYKKCRQNQDLNFEKFKPDDDIILIFENQEMNDAECLKRDEFHHVYDNSEVWQNGIKLVKLPWSGKWVSGVEKIFLNKYYLGNPIILLDDHGTIEKVYPLRIENDIKFFLDDENEANNGLNKFNDILRSFGLRVQESLRPNDTEHYRDIALQVQEYFRQLYILEKYKDVKKRFDEVYQKVLQGSSPFYIYAELTFFLFRFHQQGMLNDIINTAEKKNPESAQDYRKWFIVIQNLMTTNPYSRKISLSKV